MMEDPRVPDHVKALLGYNYDQPFWDSLRLEDVEPYLDTLDEDAAKRIGFTFKMNFYTRLAVKVLRGEQLQDREISLLGVGKGDPLSVLGAVVNIQHELLRDLYEVSTPELERIRDAMLDAGALGVKISGAGMGGVLVAVCEKGKGEEVKKAALSAGAPRGWVVRPDEGARVESLD